MALIAQKRETGWAFPMVIERLNVKNCQVCQNAELRRINRAGFVERVVLTFFGFYPWECVMCRRKRFVRDNGHRGSVRTAV